MCAHSLKASPLLPSGLSSAVKVLDDNATKGVDPRHVSWKGAAIVAKDAGSVWVNRADLNRKGFTALREKSAYFV